MSGDARLRSVPAFLWVIGVGVVLLAAVALAWSWRGPTDQEFLANATKAQDFWQQQMRGGWWTWWSPNYLGGGSLAPAWGAMVVNLWLAFWLALFGWEATGISFAVALVLAAMTAFLFVSTWSGSALTGLWAGVLYAMAPALWIRMVAVEHVVVVLAMVVLPLFLRAVIVLARNPGGHAAATAGCMLALLTLTYTKLAVVAFPVAGLLWIWETSNRGTWEGQWTWPVLGAGLVSFFWLGVVPLLPLLRESGQMIVFSLSPLAGWQEVFTLQSAAQLLDRLGWLSRDFAAGFAESTGRGGFYVGSAGVAILLAWWLGRQSLRFGPKRKCGLGTFFLSAEKLGLLRQSVGILLFCFWLAAGPRGLVGNHFQALTASVLAPPEVVLFLWGGFLLVSWLVWWLVLHGEQSPGQLRLVAASLALLVFWFVPGFRVLELLPLFDNIRSPFDFWQVVAPVFFSALGAVVAVNLFRELLSPVLRWAIGLLLVFLLVWDVAGHLIRQREQVLAPGVWEDWLAVQGEIRKPDGDASALVSAPGFLWPSSGRYFFTTSPFLSGRGLVTEAFQNYLQLRGYATLLSAGQWRPEHRENALQLSGAAWLWVDELEEETPVNPVGTEVVRRLQSQELRRVKHSLAPGFVARRVALVRREPALEDYPAMLEAMRYGLVPLERPEMNQVDPWVGGFIAEGNLVLQEESAKLASSEWEKVEMVERSADGTAWRVRWPEGEDSAPAWLVLTQPWHPDWRVWSGEEWVPVERVFGALVAAEVTESMKAAPGGAVEIRYFSPWWYDWCAWLSVLGWMLAGPVVWITRPRRMMGGSAEGEVSV